MSGKDVINYAIEVNAASKSYEGKASVLQDFSMQVPMGSIYGFIGQNGAGKSTTIKMLMGLIKADSGAGAGAVKVLGEDSWGLSVATKARIGYMPEISFHFSWMKIEEMLKYVAKFYPSWDSDLAASLMESLELEPSRKISELSLGQSRSVSFIIALSCQPDLLILDEPAANLDVLARRNFLHHVLEFSRQHGKTVMLSSHILTDLEKVVDHIGIIKKGKMVLEENLDRVKERVTQLRLVYEGAPPEFFDIPGLISMERYRNEASLVVTGFDESALSQYQSLQGARLEVQPVNLEEIFVAYSSQQTTNRT